MQLLYFKGELKLCESSFATSPRKCCLIKVLPPFLFKFGMEATSLCFVNYY